MANGQRKEDLLNEILIVATVLQAYTLLIPESAVVALTSITKGDICVHTSKQADDLGSRGNSRRCRFSYELAKSERAGPKP